MSARRDGQQNSADAAAASETEIVTETKTKTETKPDTEPETETETDSMLKIMTATPASATRATTTATATTSALTALTTVNAQNKCATAAPTTFSYLRAAKRCARLEQKTVAATKAQAQAQVQATAPARTDEEEEAFPKESTTLRETDTLRAIPCERQLCLAEHKAQLRAAFFQDLNAFTAQQQQQQPQPQPQRRLPVREIETEALRSRTPIQQLIEKFQAMIVQQPAAAEAPGQLKPAVITSSAANSDEGCNAGGISPCSSDNECDAVARRKPKVTRCASSDSALGLEVDDVNMETLPSPQRRMTLTVTDLPLRPALLPLAEPTALPDSPLTSPTSATAAIGMGVGVGVGGGVPTKVLLEERVVAALAAPPGSRRESTQSCVSELGGMPGVRYVRTPSVVVSDYSDDITACGISMEEMEYFRLQRSRGQRRCSLEASAAAAGSIGGAKDEAQSDVSAASSCSNLYYCGSTISALDGGECIVNGIRVALARKSSNSSSGELSGGDDGDIDIEQQQQQQKQQQQQQEQERERQLSELLAATQLGDGTKKLCCNFQKLSPRFFVD
ncbi:PREDICTED: uncharacterized protein LOC108619188 isoform X2 [Drosophila arizonae]|uniref:Uncharacterized protein LOC108619188 isoform X2 n=1 Tax=Drosophila arizonae TaxID=7263 RepID=A0ABM1PV39_DROAR|nr:PREDICTED: uncharacterized protein LOC108619188 isoform X2 [Drosophila arizonae]